MGDGKFIDKCEMYNAKCEMLVIFPGIANKI